MSTELELRAGNNIKAFLEHELGDYTCYKHELTGIEEYDGNRGYSVNFTIYCNGKTLHLGTFRITFNDKLKESDDKCFERDCLIEIEVYEEHYEKVETFEWTIKYFWIAILNND